GITDQILAQTDPSLTVPLNGNDADADALTYRAVVPATLAHDLGLAFAGTLSVNYGGKNDKWLVGNSGAQYFPLPDAALYRWDRTPHQATGVLMAVLTPDYYADPSLLYNAPTSPAVVTSITGGNQLVIDPAATYAGSFEVIASVGDGLAFAARRFNV